MDAEGDAPGADDDASGVAVVMEMARVCAKLKPKSTMIFAAVAAEEQGLYGSDNLAKTLKAAGYNVEGNWNNDIVGTGSFQPFSPINDYTIRLFGASILYPNASTAAEDRQIGIIGGENDSPARNLGRFIAEVAAGASKDLDMQVALIYRPDRYLRGGDHQSFLTQGFPAVRFTEAVEDYTHQHQNTRVDNGTQYGDLVEFVDFDYTSRVAKVNLATMWSAANAPAMPQNVTISQRIGIPAADEDTPLSVVNNLSAFNWTTGNDPLVASYELCGELRALCSGVMRLTLVTQAVLLWTCRRTAYSLVSELLAGMERRVRLCSRCRQPDEIMIDLVPLMERLLHRCEVFNDGFVVNLKQCKAPPTQGAQD
jgi:hypothetical protein